MNDTAKKLREAAEYIGDGETCSDTAIVTVREMFDVGRADTFGGDLGRVLVAIADELDKLQTKANEANNLRQQLESAEDKAERRKRHIGYLNTALHDKNGLLERRGGTIARLTAENGKLRKQVPSERERQILAMWPKFEDGEYVWFGDELVHKEQGHRFPVEVIEFMDDGWRACYQHDGVRDVFRPSERVERPVPEDSWERLAEDAEKLACAYLGRSEGTCFGCPLENCKDFAACSKEQAKDIVRRAKALAGVEVD